jgi:hypothetical protein
MLARQDIKVILPEKNCESRGLPEKFPRIAEQTLAKSLDMRLEDPVVAFILNM